MYLQILSFLFATYSSSLPSDQSVLRMLAILEGSVLRKSIQNNTMGYAQLQFKRSTYTPCILCTAVIATFFIVFHIPRQESSFSAMFSE